MARLDKRDLEGALKLYAPDSVWHGFAPEPLNGYEQAISVLLNAFPDSRFPVEAWISEGDLVASPEPAGDATRGNFGKFPPSGNPVTVDATVIFRVEGGKIAETWTCSA